MIIHLKVISGTITNMHTKKQLKTFFDLATDDTLHTPFMLVDRESIRSKCVEFKKHLSDTKLYYAMKCFNDEEVLKSVDDLVDGYDVASVAEIKTLLSLGVAPERMTYSNPVKSEQDIKTAFALGINNFAFQSPSEVKKLASNAPGATVYLRIHVSDAASEISFSSKFGASQHDAVVLLLQAKQAGLNPVGITFHVGSQAEDQKVWSKALHVCNKVIKECAAQGIELTLVNLGGGIPTQYNKTDPEFTTVAKSIKEAVQENTPSLSTLAEPGRYLVADSSVVVVTIIGIEMRQGMPWLFLDTGTFQSFFEVFEFGYFPYPVYSLRHQVSGESKGSDTEYALTGPSCDSYDTMTKSIYLPSDLVEGDKLVIGMSGAYTVVYGSDFNGFSVPKRKYI